MANKTIDERRIFVQKTGKKLIEFKDYLDPVKGEELHRNNLHSSFSKIRVVVKDYEKGTGEKAIDAYLNLDPDSVLFLANKIETLERNEPFEYAEEKINSYRKDEKGLCPVTKFTLKHIPTMKSPWTIIVETGIGEPQENGNGGISCKSGTFVSQVSVSNVLTDKNIHASFTKAARLILNFEKVLQIKLIQAYINTKAEQ